MKTISVVQALRWNIQIYVDRGRRFWPWSGPHIYFDKNFMQKYRTHPVNNGGRNDPRILYQSSERDGEIKGGRCNTVSMIYDTTIIK